MIDHDPLLRLMMSTIVAEQIARKSNEGRTLVGNDTDDWSDGIVRAFTYAFWVKKFSDFATGRDPVQKFGLTVCTYEMWSLVVSAFNNFTVNARVNLEIANVILRNYRQDTIESVLRLAPLFGVEIDIAKAKVEIARLSEETNHWLGNEFATAPLRG